MIRLTRRPSTAPRKADPRRGTAAIAVVIMLVLLQMSVAGMVLSGGRDQDLSTRRMDTVRAFYAAEAGINMAVRELSKSVDYDADGTIGTISNDSNANNDPALGSARVCVTKATSGSTITLTSRGRAGDSTRVITLTTK
jgi:Tfp pilus assembly protein PilX